MLDVVDRAGRCGEFNEGSVCVCLVEKEVEVVNAGAVLIAVPYQCGSQVEGASFCGVAVKVVVVGAVVEGCGAPRSNRGIRECAEIPARD